MQILMPQLGETVSEGTILAWRRRAGEAVAADEILLEIETDKAAVEVPAPAAGIVGRILVDAGETVPVGTPLADFDVAGERGTTAAAPQGATSAQESAVPPSHVAPGQRSAKRDSRGRPVSPAVRRFVQQHGIDLGRIDGSGRAGRVRLRDAIAHADSTAPGTRVAADPAGAANIVPFNRFRKRTAEHMLRSKATSPHVLQAVEVDFSSVAAARTQIKEEWLARQGYALTFLPFVCYSVCRAIAEFPAVNASVEGEALRLHEDVNLAVAVDLSFQGLVAPVLHHAQLASVAQLASQLHELTQRAYSGKLSPGDLSGGSYTISNSGSFGTLITAPIINQPQVAILSMDGIRKRPVVIETAQGDALAIRPVGILAQSFDHRAIDGAYSAAFLRKLREIIELTDWSALVPF